VHGTVTDTDEATDARQSACVLAMLAASLCGFFGFYGPTGFVSLPPWSLLGLQIVLGTFGLLLLPRAALSRIFVLWPLFLFAAWAAATSIWSYDPPLAMQRAALINVPALLLAVLAMFDPSPQRTIVWIVRLLAALAILSAFFVVVIVLVGEPVGESSLILADTRLGRFGMMIGGRQFLSLGIEAARYSGITTNPNGLALLSGITLVAFVAVGPSAIASRWGRIAILAVLIALMAVTLARSAALLVLVGFAMLVLLRRRWNVFATVAVTSVIALPLALAALTAAGSMGNNELPLEEWQQPDGGEAASLGQRSVIWLHMMRTALEVWPHGLGFGLTEEAVFRPLGFPTSAHTVPLTLLVETGLPGLALAMLAWFRPVFGLLRSRVRLSPAGIAIVALLVAIFAHQVFDASAFRYHWGHFTLAWLIGAAANSRLSTHGTNDR